MDAYYLLIMLKFLFVNTLTVFIRQIFEATTSNKLYKHTFYAVQGIIYDIDKNIRKVHITSLTRPGNI